MVTSNRARVVALAMLVMLPSRVLAAPTKLDVDRAEALFVEARDLMDLGRYSEACPKLVEAHRLDPGGGTLLALALCHEGEGRGATALREFAEARTLAEQAGRRDRVDLAVTHVKKLEAQVSRVIVTPKQPGTTGLSIILDQQPVPKARWGIAIFVDAGAHLVVVGAPGRKSWSATVSVNGYGDVKRVEVPELEPTAPADVGDVTPSGGGRVTAGYVLGSLGLVALGVGGYFGVRTFMKTREYKDACPQGTCADQHGLDLNADAKRSGTIATVAIGIGLAGVVSAAILFLSAPSRRAPGGVKTDAMVTPTGFAFGLHGDF